MAPQLLLAQPKPPLQVAIVGGGISGLSLGIRLERAGVAFHIYEAASRFSEIGAGLGLAPNAQRAMELIDPRIREVFDACTTTNADEEHRRFFFEFRMGMKGRPGTGTEGWDEGDLVSRPGGEGKGMSMVHRSRFLEGLSGLLAPGRVSFGKRLKGLEQSGDRPRLIFEDGLGVEADVVVGCDGVKSVVRDSLFGEGASARFSGKYAYRGLVPMAEAIAVVGEEHALNSQAYIGYGGHVLTMAVEGGSLMNVVAFRTKEDGVWNHKTWTLPLQLGEMEHDFEGWSDGVRGILRLLRQADKWALFDHPSLPSLCLGRACLMGDAAHATTPHQGSGAAMAIEDAHVLGRLLGAIEGTTGLPAVFEAYDAVRLERCMRVVWTSRECGELYEFQDSTVGDDLNLLDRNLRNRYHWIWDEDVEGLWLKARQVLSSCLEELE